MPISHCFMPNNGIHLIPIFSSTLVITFPEANKVTDHWDLVTTQVVWSSSPPTDEKEETQLFGQGRESENRHKGGFIWFSDDLDVMMYKKNYLHRFLACFHLWEEAKQLQRQFLTALASAIYSSCCWIICHLFLAQFSSFQPPAFYVVLILGGNCPFKTWMTWQLI